jgi:hypothetical protein
MLDHAGAGRFVRHLTRAGATNPPLLFPRSCMAVRITCGKKATNSGSTVTIVPRAGTPIVTATPIGMGGILRSGSGNLTPERSLGFRQSPHDSES